MKYIRPALYVLRPKHGLLFSPIVPFFLFSPEQDTTRTNSKDNLWLFSVVLSFLLE